MPGDPPGFVISRSLISSKQKKIRTRFPLDKGSDHIDLVETEGFEPLTSRMRTERSPS